MSLSYPADVTSLAEVWIETKQASSRACKATVTSLAEVWIETKNYCILERIYLSLPLRKCGLKHDSFALGVNVPCVTSLAEVWIETKSY